MDRRKNMTDEANNQFVPSKQLALQNVIICEIAMEVGLQA
jgi:hypothetical protein